MRILVTSDTHGEIDRAIEVDKELAAEAPVDMSVHYEDSVGGSQSGKGTPGAKSMAKPKVKGGHLRDLINYSDRF